jgi:hypothetical protein
MIGTFDLEVKLQIRFSRSFPSWPRGLVKKTRVRSTP